MHPSLTLPLACLPLLLLLLCASIAYVSIGIEADMDEWEKVKKGDARAAEDEGTAEMKAEDKQAEEHDHKTEGKEQGKADKRPVMEKEESLLRKLGVSLGLAKDELERRYYRTEIGRQYTTLDDFERMVPERKRILVIGCTGAGKSTLINKMAGNKCTKDRYFQFQWDKDPIFESGSGTDSVTKLTSFANVNWFGDTSKPVVIVDTPGHDDPAGSDITEQTARDKLGELAADLHNKLKTMGRVDLILVIHNDPVSNRLNPVTMTILKMVDEKFKKSSKSVWDSLVMAYSKCDDGDSPGWCGNMEPFCKPNSKSKQKEMQEMIMNSFPDTCKKPIPILCLSGVEPTSEGAAASTLAENFAKLYGLLMSADGVDTSELQPFDGPDRKFEAIVAEMDAKQAMLDAMEAQNMVVSYFVALLLFFAWRTIFIPSFLRIFVMDLPGPLDELILLLLVVQFLGYTKVKLSMQLFYKNWLQTYVERALLAAGVKTEAKQKVS